MKNNDKIRLTKRHWMQIWKSPGSYYIIDPGAIGTIVHYPDGLLHDKSKITVQFPLSNNISIYTNIDFHSLELIEENETL